MLVEMSDGNIRKVVKILKKNGYGAKVPVDPLKLGDAKTRASWIKEKHMKAFNFYKEGSLEEVDIIIDTPITYEDAKKDIVRVKSGNVVIPVISIDNLIRMKQETDRSLDKTDIEALRRIKKLKAAK